MHQFLDKIDYDDLISQNLLGVVKDALTIASEQGLPGENHFYITFKTNFEGVIIPRMLQIQYPENMTIVLQHQFSELTVNKDKFSVELVFGGVPYKLVIPFKAITYFADPHAKFGLSFEAPERASSLEDVDIKAVEEKQKGTPAEVISIDRFRNKK